jgi:hypothetical protein
LKTRIPHPPAVAVKAERPDAAEVQYTLGEVFAAAVSIVHDLAYTTGRLSAAADPPDAAERAFLEAEEDRLQAGLDALGLEQHRLTAALAALTRDGAR